MDPVFSIGISSLWDELRHMPAGGVWWVNTDRVEDAISLANQTIAFQTVTAKVAGISMGSDPGKIFKLDESHGPEKIQLFSMPNSEKGLQFMTRDLLCSVDPTHYLFILICANNGWQNIPAERLRLWLDKMNKWTRLHHCSVVVLNPGNNNDKQFSLLMGEYRSLYGLASMRYQGDQHLFDIAFWCNEKGVSARQQLTVRHHEGQWELAQKEEAEIQPRSDEKQILSNVAVLEGAPPLSEHWKLFDNNEALFNEARTAQAATLIFSLQQNSQIEPLARSIHTLRRQRGSALKILVRENIASLRATDERLLLGCGANMVIPWNAPLSRCLTLIESVQGQQFSRYVPEDITTLLSMTQPMKLRGFQKWDVFCEAVNNMMSNTLLPADGKGVMVALRPVPGIRVEQALTMCRPHRTGDIVTIGGNRLVLFLSFCRVNDLDTALNHIFPLPTGDLFSNRMVWFEDNLISAELVQMRLLAPEQWGQPLPLTQNVKPVINAEHDGKTWRRIPQPLRLLDDETEHSS
ncbi:TPA: cellulose biosynthesis c-di-GMP-binding protein BcsE [Citrobacter amalonaticus]|uniref:cellulose biosynthesis c-di-GMP-binding protein BcsE n=1 Tax=Citrobacter TaxID=544 RepID=UPI0006216AC1|nr:MULTISPECIES: cellulose biosynthesis c-di-GMP-binding protein BcsE [Citrobacter]KKF69559.1 cellulose biosynthesis protein BcsE [Vibrio parahaemolyticus]EKW3842262.1 cellulose biosynthesis protein BcsE [Citrobacter amalonaticus]EKW5056208.1 cellulose biosynthesis protein BcsE [Citrobacter amalonaticus]EKX8494210.1 cellulose biosynthesis protein BcsE [Citrobacter amalonaticus]ELO0857613.1 cellulose biosynthesis protein BcsE [Citrobacter amalonaticus]